jgi:hypothetical protein
VQSRQSQASSKQIDVICLGEQIDTEFPLTAPNGGFAQLAPPVEYLLS